MLDDLEREKSIKEICKVLAKVQDEDFIFEFFQCLFTQAELNDFANRWCLVKALDEGITQREIAKMYNMSLCNITRGSKEMKKENSAFKRFLDIYKEC